MSSADSPARPARDSSIENSKEYDDFIASVQAYHIQRGTSFDPHPKVGKKQVDLLKLYNRVTGEGGYDAVSDTKANKLAWRKIGHDFRLGNDKDPTLAFTLKTAYYKNLVAYEIQHFHHKDPPPPSILEEVTAKGGNVMSRTVDNYQKPATREEQRLANGVGQEAEDEEPSPKADPSVEEGGRATRGLRQAPPPRQMFTGEVNQPRGARGQPNGAVNSPAPAFNVAAYNAPVPQNLASYEPRQQPPIPLRPVLTPGNNYDEFKAEQKRLHDRTLPRNRIADMVNRGLILPGTGFGGPMIYTRTLLALQSGILEEQEYALHHLVKISHERGDRYRFDSFPGLAEALINKVLEIGDLALDVEWSIDYKSPQAFDGEVITESRTGSTDIQQTVNISKKRKRHDKLEPVEFSRRLTMVQEAGLVLRNMVMQQENAEFLSRFPALRSLLIVLLSVPSTTATSEVQHYGLELAEQLGGYLEPKEDDQLYRVLMTFIERNDRGVILCALRAVCRLGSYYRKRVRLVNVSPKLIQKLCAWVYIEDEELRAASLDFLCQYTAIPENVDTLLRIANVDGLVKQLVRLLLHGARVQDVKEQPRPVTQQKPAEDPQDIPIPRISPDHVDILLGYDEPERSTQWLRACFEEDTAGEITQIALWQAYQAPFQPFISSRPLLPAKDFITNVSSTFARASAQVINGTQPKFVIKGIKPRRIPIDPRGKKFMRCLWHVEKEQEEPASDDEPQQSKTDECGDFARDSKAMWEHIVKSHLDLAKDADGKWTLASTLAKAKTKKPAESDDAKDGDLDHDEDADADETEAKSEPGANGDTDTTMPDAPDASKTYTCAWAGCLHFAQAPSPSPFAVGMHVKTHLPDPPDRPGTSIRARHNRAPGAFASGTAARTWTQRTTQLDDAGSAAGLPLTAALVLRNIAAGIPAAGAAARAGDGGAGILERVFAPVRAGLFEVLAVNRAVEGLVVRLLSVVDLGVERGRGALVGAQGADDGDADDE